MSPDRPAGAAVRAVAVVLALAVAAPAAAQRGAMCGEDRWDVKVLRDADAARVNFEAVATSVGALVGLPRPLESRPKAGRLALELRTFRVRARLLETRTQADGDLHLVLADIADPAIRLVAEIPDSLCAIGTRRASDFAEAQRWALQAGTPIEVEVEGVAFWDDEHGQVGMARNGIELHPVLRIAPVLTRSDILRAEAGADPPDPKAVRVWVNTASKVYHCPGSTNYGTTDRGLYMPESAAVRVGARPAAGVSCTRP